MLNELGNKIIRNGYEMYERYIDGWDNEWRMNINDFKNNNKF